MTWLRSQGDKQPGDSPTKKCGLFHLRDTGGQHFRQGPARLTVEGVEHEMRMGDIALIEPGEEHHLLADEPVAARRVKTDG